jgi:ABC-2 type transport system permease protein
VSIAIPVESAAPPERVQVPEGRLFLRLRGRLMRNGWSMLVGNSRMRLATIVACSVVIWASVFAVGWWGFDLLESKQIPGAGAIVGIVFDLMFFTLGMMLVFSSGIMLYASLFTSAEAKFLLGTPARDDQIFAYKFQSAVAFSSWAFVLLGSPILIAYGVIFHSPWYFYALLAPFFVGYVLLPGAGGAMGCLLVVNYLPRKRKQFLGVLLGVIAAAGLVWVFKTATAAQNSLLTQNRDALQGLLEQFTFAKASLLPSHWMTRGLQSAARGELDATWRQLALIWSNGLFLYLVTAFASAKLYRRGFNRLSTGGSARQRYRRGWLDRTAEAMVAYLDPQTRLLIIKDFRSFRRDPAQVGQLLILFGLVLLYGVIYREFYQEEFRSTPQYGISFVNLLATATLLCAYMGRFIYPMLSLEGRKFWVLGLLPLRRERLLWGKFAFAATGAVVAGEILMVASDLMLGMPPLAIAVHAVVVAVLALGLSGLSVGLGAWMPNFRESDPSKIAVGFGGTLNLIASLLFLVVVVGVMAGPYHVQSIAAKSETGGLVNLNAWVPVGLFWGIVAGAVSVWLPMRVGSRTLRRMEF